MAKKDKNKQTETQSPVTAAPDNEWDTRELGADPAHAIKVSDAEEVEMAAAPAVPQERVWDLHDAARQMIKDYKETWWPSIHKMARTHAVKDKSKESVCRKLFRMWGAELK